MGLFGSFRGRFGGSKVEAPPTDLSSLADKLKEKRGDNITVVDSAGSIPPNRDAIENLTNAARDARIVDRSNEDDSISDLGTYRNVD
ncbi:MAG: hypothetical protein GY929_06545 [Actinomycetia bacterium]|nr:hypothetical protein [Actinomycetes bacterium]